MTKEEFAIQVFGRLREEIVSLQGLRSRLYMFKATALGAVWFAAGYSESKRPDATLIAMSMAPVVAAELSKGLVSTLERK